MTKQRLELTWIGKDERPRLEPRILIEDRSHGVHSGNSDGNHPHNNMIIHGDNLLALKAIEASYTGKVKCIFIDPPYNTGSAFEQYNDGVEHSLWLTMMRDRLELLHRLLAEDGSLWITVDDNESHYLKVLCDEIFGRKNFITSVIWHKVLSVKNSARHFSVDHDYIFVYAKNSDIWRPNPVGASEKQREAYKNPDQDARGPWQSVSLSARNYYSKGTYAVTTPAGRVIEGPPPGRFWSISEENLLTLDTQKRIWWGKGGDGVPRRKVFLSEQGTLVKVPQTLWSFEEVGHTQDAKKESVALFGEKAFATPKPEHLLRRILEIATSPGELVLDSFAGSGTTGAVAHKMRRPWIMVELGAHAISHVLPRLTKVVEGKDQGGITEVTGWKGGGSFRFFRLAPSLMRQDRYGQWVISSEYQPEMLAEAVCKLMGFTYSPSPEASTYWRHGHSTETDFIFITTQAMTHDALAKLSDEVGEGRTLLVACRAYAARADAFPNLTMKKIPQVVLTRCEWGRDDYSLTIPSARQPQDEVEIVDAADLSPTPAKAKRGRPRASRAESPSLFGEEA